MICYVCVVKQTFGSYCPYWTDETMIMGNSITNWMLWKGPSEKDKWQGIDSKTMFVFEKVIKKSKEQNICGKRLPHRRSFQT